MAVELGDDITGQQSEKLSRAVDVQLPHFHAPFLRARNGAAKRIEYSEEALIARFCLWLRRRECPVSDLDSRADRRPVVIDLRRDFLAGLHLLHALRQRAVMSAALI